MASFIGVSGSYEGLEQMPDGKLLSSMGRSCGSLRTKRVIESKFGWRVPDSGQFALAKVYDGASLLRWIKPSNPQKTFWDGLAWIAKESRRLHQCEFTELTWAQ